MQSLDIKRFVAKNNQSQNMRSAGGALESADQSIKSNLFDDRGRANHVVAFVLGFISLTCGGRKNVASKTIAWGQINTPSWLYLKNLFWGFSLGAQGLSSFCCVCARADVTMWLGFIYKKTGCAANGLSDEDGVRPLTRRPRCVPLFSPHHQLKFRHTIQNNYTALSYLAGVFFLLISAAVFVTIFALCIWRLIRSLLNSRIYTEKQQLRKSCPHQVLLLTMILMTTGGTSTYYVIVFI